MDDAAREVHVQLDELMDGVGRRLGELTGAEWGIVTSGASAALTVAAAGCITGGDPDKLAQLPDLKGLEDDIIAPRYSRSAYDHAVKGVGARIVEVATREELAAALGPRTALVDGAGGTRVGGGTAVPKEIALLAGRRAAFRSSSMPRRNSLVVPNRTLCRARIWSPIAAANACADRSVPGCSSAARVLCRRPGSTACPITGSAAGSRWAAKRSWACWPPSRCGKSATTTAEARTWVSWLEHIARRLQPIPGVTTQIRQPQGRSNRTPTLRVQWDMARIPLTGDAVETLLWDGEPRICGERRRIVLLFPPNLLPDISIVPYQLEAGEERVVIADRVYAVLSHPPRTPQRTNAPAFDVGGQWDVALTFVHGGATHAFALEQKDGALTGTHAGSFATRDLAGTLQGRDSRPALPNTAGRAAELHLHRHRERRRHGRQGQLRRIRNAPRGRPRGAARARGGGASPATTDAQADSARVPAALRGTRPSARRPCCGNWAGACPSPRPPCR